jgi:hypothetical protein
MEPWVALPPWKPCRFTPPANPRPFARPGDIDEVAHLEDGRRQFLPRLKLDRRQGLELSQHTEEPPVGLCEVALQGFRHVLLPLAVKAELDGIVAVRLFGFFLYHGAGSRLDHRDGDRGPVGGEDLGHPQLSAY